MKLSIRSIDKQFGEHRVLNGLCLDVKNGEFVAVLGPSGCGKSTLLRIAGGFDLPDSGETLLDGAPVTAPSKRMIMIFQDFNQLFPWKTLLQNLTYAIRKTEPGLAKADVQMRTRQCIDEVGLTGFERSYPHQLSGGMKQRGALARALALNAEVLLMDEPFSSLDYLTRRNAQDTLLQLWERKHLAVVFVTHDIDEALALAQRILVFDKNTRRIEHSFASSSSPALKSILEALLRSQE